MQGIAPDALKLLVEYAWPGNIREMQTAVRSALLKTNGPVLVADALPVEIHAASTTQAVSLIGESAGVLERMLDQELRADAAGLYDAVLATMEGHLLTRVLALTSGNLSHAARILGITRGSLRHKIELHRIQTLERLESADEIDDPVALASCPASG